MTVLIRVLSYFLRDLKNLKIKYLKKSFLS